MPTHGKHAKPSASETSRNHPTAPQAITTLPNTGETHSNPKLHTCQTDFYTSPFFHAVFADESRSFPIAALPV
jgi:hypothetical protein